MKLDLKDIPVKFKKLLGKLNKYAGFAFIITIILIYGFLIFRIGTLSQAEPSQEAVTDKLKTVKRLKVDQGAIDKIQQLEDQNIGVQSLFEAARDNPFQDN